MKGLIREMVHALMRCPACGYWAFNGVECFDCGYRTNEKEES